MLVAFKLSMPGCNSWNGRWSGEDSLYAVVESFRGKKQEAKAEQLKGYHTYNFGDGWTAGVEVSFVTKQEAAKIRKLSKGFNGYYWMIESLCIYGEILNSEQCKERERA